MLFDKPTTKEDYIKENNEKLKPHDLKIVPIEEREIKVKENRNKIWIWIVISIFIGIIAFGYLAYQGYFKSTISSMLNQTCINTCPAIPSCPAPPSCNCNFPTSLNLRLFNET